MIARTCTDHRAILAGRASCPVCRRLSIERRIATRAVDGLLEAGYALTVDDGDGETRPAQPTRDRAAILRELGETDDDRVICYTDRDTARRLVRFVYGNDGYDVLADHSSSLTEALSEAQKLADAIERTEA